MNQCNFVRFSFSSHLFIRSVLRKKLNYFSGKQTQTSGKFSSLTIFFPLHLVRRAVLQQQEQEQAVIPFILDAKTKHVLLINSCLQK